MYIEPLPALPYNPMKQDPLEALRGLADFIPINKDDPMGELQSHCVKASQIAAACARINAAYELNKMYLDDFKAGCYLYYRQKMTPKMTEAEIEASTLKQDEYKRLKILIIDLQEQKFFLDRLVGIMNDRMALLINITKHIQQAEGQVR